MTSFQVIIVASVSPFCACAIPLLSNALATIVWISGVSVFSKRRMTSFQVVSAASVSPFCACAIPLLNNTLATIVWISGVSVFSKRRMTSSRVVSAASVSPFRACAIPLLHNAPATTVWISGVSVFSKRRMTSSQVVIAASVSPFRACAIPLLNNAPATTVYNAPATTVWISGVSVLSKSRITSSQVVIAASVSPFCACAIPLRASSMMSLRRDSDTSLPSKPLMSGFVVLNSMRRIPGSSDMARSIPSRMDGYCSASNPSLPDIFVSSSSL